MMHAATPQYDYPCCFWEIWLWLEDCTYRAHVKINCAISSDCCSQSCEQFTHLDHQTGGCCLIEMVGILGPFSDMFGL